MIALITIIGVWLLGWIFNLPWPAVALVLALAMPILYWLDTEALWRDFLAIMHLQEAENANRLPTAVMPNAKALLYVGLARDLIYNWTWAIWVFRDLPRELLVTQRLERYKYGRAYRLVFDRHGECWRFWKWRVRIEEIRIPPATGWRLERTDWYAANRLDPFDPSGPHLRP